MNIDMATTERTEAGALKSGKNESIDAESAKWRKSLEGDPNSIEMVSPKYSLPIVLTNYSSNGLYTRGVELNSGLYNIEYSLCVTAENPFGLALFDRRTWAFRELITWHTFTANNELVRYYQGSKYVEIMSASTLGLTDKSLTLDPAYIWGKYIVMIHRLSHK